MPNAPLIRPKGEGSLVELYVTTGARKTALLTVREDGRVKVAVAAQPEDGRANKELLGFFKAKYGECALFLGQKSRKKTVYIKKTGPTELARQIASNI